MRLLLDMNLSPELCPRFEAAGYEAVHWSSVGALNASDETIMLYARDHACVVVSHDLDFSAMLAATHADGPSVVQVRTQDVMSDRLVSLLCAALKQFESDLNAGALVVIDESRSRVRVLPME